MKHRTWIVALLVALVATGALAAQTPSTGDHLATSPSVSTHMTLTAAQLSQILGTGEPGGISTTPPPAWETCTPFTCRQGCRDCKNTLGCISVCVDTINCVCECQC